MSSNGSNKSNQLWTRSGKYPKDESSHDSEKTFAPTGKWTDTLKDNEAEKNNQNADKSKLPAFEKAVQNAGSNVTSNPGSISFNNGFVVMGTVSTEQVLFFNTFT